MMILLDGHATRELSSWCAALDVAIEADRGVDRRAEEITASKVGQ
jgi:hypothetical protein